MDQPSALRLAIAAAFAPLNNQGFVSEVTHIGDTRVGINFTDFAPRDLGPRISSELFEGSVELTESGIEIDLSALTSRVEIRSVGLQVAEILIASGSTSQEISDSFDSARKNFDQRDREFLDNVPPHHGV